MVYLYWDFANPKLKNITDIQKCNMIVRLRDELKIPVSQHLAGFNSPYIEIEGRESDMKMMALLNKDDMIPREIKRVAVRHLTYQSEEFVEKIQKIAEDELTRKNPKRMFEWKSREQWESEVGK